MSKKPSTKKEEKKKSKKTPVKKSSALPSFSDSLVSGLLEENYKKIKKKTK